MRHVLLVDLGTGNTRVALADSAGTILDMRTYTNSYYRDDAYEDAQYFLPAEWEERILRGCRELCEAHPEIRVSAVSSAGARQSFVLLDREGMAFYGLPNIDNRGRAFMDQVPDPEEVYRLSGKWCTEDFGAAKLLGLRQRRPELYEQWCESHPITELPKWKRGENVRLVKTEEQFAAAAKLFAEGRRAVCAGNWTEEYCASLTEEEFLAQLKAEKKGGWACYLHTTKDVPDGMVSVDHKTGRIEHLFVSGNARGKGIGQKMLDFARKKLEEYEHPRLSVLDTNARAIALYRRMGWKFTGEKDMEFDPAEYPSVVKKCALLWMQYEG